MQTLVKYLVLCSLSLVPLAAQPVTFDFGTPVSTVNTQTDTPGSWYIDRFPPHGFVSPVVAPDGTPNTLRESIAAADLQPGISFYNTQGRKFDIPPTSTAVTIFLYVPAGWATENARKAGFWNTALPNSGNGDFPIIEFQGPITSPVTNGPSYQPNGGIAGFYGWNNVTGSFDFIGLPAGFTYNHFVQLTITLVPGSHFVYTVGDPTSGGVSIISPLGNAGDTGLGNVILQGYNYGFDYAIYWAGGLVPRDAAQVDYAANLTAGDSFVNLTNAGSIGGSDPAGDICANVYVFAQDQQLIACCSCLLTPNHLKTLSARNDLVNNTLTPGVPTGITTVLVASVAGASGSCNPTRPGTRVPGLRAWGTTLHAAPGGTFATTETHFRNVALSTSELAKMENDCAFIEADGSGSGICNSCTSGAAGGNKK